MRTSSIAAVLMATIWLAPAAAQQTDAKAQDVIAQARKAIGGKKLDALQSLSVQAGGQRNVGNFQLTSEVEMLVDLPDKYMKSETSSGGPMTMTNISGFNGDTPIKASGGGGGGVTGGAVIIRMGPGAASGPGTPPAEKPTAEQQQEIDRQLARAARQEISRFMLGWFAATHPAMAAHYTYAGEAESADGKAFVVDVKDAGGFAARLFIDEKTNLPLMVTYQGAQPRMITSGSQADAQKQVEEMRKQPPAMVEHALYFDDWREVDGIRFPHVIRRAIAGATTEEWTVTKVRVNPKIDPKKFATAQ